MKACILQNKIVNFFIMLYNLSVEGLKVLGESLVHRNMHWKFFHHKESNEIISNAQERGKKISEIVRQKTDFCLDKRRIQALFVYTPWSTAFA